MSSHWIPTLIPPPAEVPRGAVLFGEAAAWLWIVLRARARAVLRVLRRRVASKRREEPRHA